MWCAPWSCRSEPMVGHDPGRVEAEAQPAKRLAFSFDYRFFLVPADRFWVVDSRYSWTIASSMRMVAWDLLLAAAWLIDLLSLAEAEPDSRPP